MELARSHPGVALQPTLLSTGMGDLKSSRVAQAYGQWLMRAAGGLRDETWLSYGFPPPSGDLWVGTYLDDIITCRQNPFIGALRLPSLRKRRRLPTRA